jgi:hypothetical protein
MMATNVDDIIRLGRSLGTVNLSGEKYAIPASHRNKCYTYARRHVSVPDFTSDRPRLSLTLTLVIKQTVLSVYG